MNKTKGNIGTKEFFAVIVLTIGTKLEDDTPSILYTSMENAAWMAPIIIGVLSILPIFLLTKIISQYPDKNLIEIILHLFGKYFGYFVLFTLWLIQTYALVIDSAIYSDIIGSLYFSTTPNLIIYTLLIAVAAYGAKKGIEHIASFAWIVITAIKISAFAALLMIFLQGDISFIFPILGPGVWEIAKESTTFASIFGDFLFLSFIAFHLKSTKVFKKGVWMALLFVTFELTFALIGYVLLFDYNAVEMLNFPFHEAIRYIEFGFLTNVESLFFPFWLLSTFTRFAFYFYISSLLFGTLFKIRQYEYVIPTLAILIVLLGSIPETPTFSIFSLRKTFLHFAAPIFLFLPALLWIMAKLKGDVKREKTKTSQ